MVSSIMPLPTTNGSIGAYASAHLIDPGYRWIFCAAEARTQNTIRFHLVSGEKIRAGLGRQFQEKSRAALNPLARHTEQRAEDIGVNR